MNHPFANLLKGRTKLARQKGRRSVFPPAGHAYTAFLESWVDQLSSARRPTVSMYRVALAIQRAAFAQHTPSPTLSNRIPGVDRRAKYLALKRLEQIGLTRIEQRPGCAPVIHIVLTPKAAGL